MAAPGFVRPAHGGSIEAPRTRASGVGRLGSFRCRVSFGVHEPLVSRPAEAPERAAEFVAEVVTAERIHHEPVSTCRPAPSKDLGAAGTTDLQNAGKPPYCTVFEFVGNVAVQSDHGRAILFVERDTRLLHKGAEGPYTLADFDDLNAGDDVEVWTDDGLVESDPMQTEVETLVIVPD